MIDKNLQRKDLKEALKISSSTLTKMSRGEPVSRGCPYEAMRIKTADEVFRILSAGMGSSVAVACLLPEDTDLNFTEIGKYYVDDAIKAAKKNDVTWAIVTNGFSLPRTQWCKGNERIKQLIIRLRRFSLRMP